MARSLNDLFVYLENEPGFRAVLEQLIVQNNKQAVIIRQLDERLLDILVQEMKNLKISQSTASVPGGGMQQQMAEIEFEMLVLRERMEQMSQLMLGLEQQLEQYKEQQEPQEEMMEQQQIVQNVMEDVAELQQGSLQQQKAHMEQQLGELEMLPEQMELDEQGYDQAVLDQAQFQIESVALFDELLQQEEVEPSGQQPQQENQVQMMSNWDQLLHQGYDNWEFVSLPEEQESTQQLLPDEPDEVETNPLQQQPEQHQAEPNVEGEEESQLLPRQQPQHHRADPDIEEEEVEEDEAEASTHPAGRQQYREIVLRTRRILVPVRNACYARTQPAQNAFTLPSVGNLPTHFRSELVEPSIDPFVVHHHGTGNVKIECRIAECHRSFGSIRGWKVHVARIHPADGYCTRCGRNVVMPPNANEEERRAVMAAHTSDWCPRPSLTTLKERQVKRRRLELLARYDDANRLYVPEQ